MCKLALIGQGRAAADDILHRYMRLPISKAQRIDTSAAFDRSVARLAAELRARAREPEEQANKAALEALDVDWRILAPAAREALVRRAVDAAQKATIGPVGSIVDVALGAAATNVVKATRAAARESGLSIGANLSSLDQRIVAHVASSHTFFVRDAFGRRLENFEQKARELVANGVVDGLGRDAIAADLASAARRAFIHQAGNYWEVVAAAFTGQARSYAQVSSYSEAGVKTYQIEAVMDEATSEVCRSMHGRNFKVSNAVQFIVDGMKLASVEALKAHAPWGVAAEAANIPLPPYHGLCRTTTGPVGL